MLKVSTLYHQMMQFSCAQCPHQYVLLTSQKPVHPWSPVMCSKSPPSTTQNTVTVCSMYLTANTYTEHYSNKSLHLLSATTMLVW